MGPFSGRRGLAGCYACARSLTSYSRFEILKGCQDTESARQEVCSGLETAVTLASDVVTPFDVSNFGVQMASYFSELESTISCYNLSVDLTPLASALATFNESASQAMSFKADAVASGEPSAVDLINKKFRDYETGLVSQGGLPNREFYRHVVTAPRLNMGYAATTFPGITEAVTTYGDEGMANEWVGRTARAVEVAAGILAD